MMRYSITLKICFATVCRENKENNARVKEHERGMRFACTESFGGSKRANETRDLPVWNLIGTKLTCHKNNQPHRLMYLVEDWQHGSQKNQHFKVINHSIVRETNKSLS